MGPEDRQRADRLDRYWDAVVQHEPGTLTAEVDTVTATIIAQLNTPPASPRFLSVRQRVRQTIVTSARATAADLSTPRGSFTTEKRHYVPDASRLRSGPTWFRDVAAAVMLIAVGAVILFGLLQLRRDQDQHTGGPAVHAPASASQEATSDETVLQLTLPAASLPTGDGVGAGLAVFTIAPGTRSTWNQTCCPGVLVEYVLSGQYTVRSQAAMTVVRAGGAVEEVPARTEVVLNPGDSLVSRDEVGVEAANTGTEPVSLLSWLLITGDGTFNSRVQLPMWVEFGSQFTGHKLPGWVEGLPGDVREMADVQGPIKLDAAPATIQLRRVTIPDDSIVPLPADGLQFLAPVGPHADKLRQADHSFRILGEIGQPVTVYILTLQQTDP